MHEFIDMNSFGKIHQDLQTKRISRDFNDVQALMNLLKDTMINLVEEKFLMPISSRISPADKVKDSLSKAYSIGKEAMEHFINSCLVSLAKSIYDSIKKLKLGTFSNKTKRVTVKLRGKDIQISVQCEIFGKIALISQSRVLDLKEIFKYSLRSIPYALADHMGVMVKTKKSDLLIELEKSAALVGQMPKSLRSIIDGMVLVRKVKCSARVDIVFDVYFEQSIKNIERNQRYSGTISFKKIVGSHVALQWKSFLDLSHNKTEFVKFLTSEWDKKNITEKVTYVTYGEKCVCLNDDQEVPALYCAQEETDTRMILHAKHASHYYRDIVIHIPDTDIIVLAIAFSKDIDSNILVKTGVKNKARIISIEIIIDKLVKRFSMKNISSATHAILGLHAFTGCDTVSAF